MTHDHIGALSPNPTFTLGDSVFHLVQRLSPRRDASGSIALDYPQDRFGKKSSSTLHQYGTGAFCSFRIDVAKGRKGVYLFVVDGAIRYIGECEDLRRWFNTGYGLISPRNCYVGGQPTNCKINQHVLRESLLGYFVDLYFLETPDCKTVEREILSSFMPAWNGRR